jgi:hypothetical protein
VAAFELMLPQKNLKLASYLPHLAVNLKLARFYAYCKKRMLKLG